MDQNEQTFLGLELHVDRRTDTADVRFYADLANNGESGEDFSLEAGWQTDFYMHLGGVYALVADGPLLTVVLHGPATTDQKNSIAKIVDATDVRHNVRGVMYPVEHMGIKGLVVCQVSALWHQMQGTHIMDDLGETEVQYRIPVPVELTDVLKAEAARYTQ